MIIKKTATEHKEFSLEGDKFKILHAEKIPDGFMASLEILRKEKGLKWVDKDKEWHMVGRIPKIIYDRLWHDFPDEMRDPDSKWLYEWLDTDEGKVWKAFTGRAS